MASTETRYINANMDLWKQYFSSPDKVQRYRNVLHLVHIMLVVPVATAQVERQFSFIKRYLGDWRLSLSQDTIESLLRICIDGAYLLENLA